MGKYYIKSLNPEGFDYEIYYDEESAKQDKLWLGGNRDFIEINEDLLKDVVTALTDAGEDIENILYSSDDELDNDEEDIAKDIADTIKYYFKKVNRDPLKNSEINKLFKIATAYSECSSNEEDDYICQVLEILWGFPFINGTLRGSSQGDWIDYICPASLEDKLSYIEAVFFGTGTEYAISETPLDNSEDFDQADTFCDYTELYRDDEVKAWAAKDIGCNPSDVEILPANY